MKRNRVEIKLADMAAAEPVNTWSATKPAYAFTPLCPDVRYRPGGELYGMVIKRRDADGAIEKSGGAAD